MVEWNTQQTQNLPSIALMGSNPIHGTSHINYGAVVKLVISPACHAGDESSMLFSSAKICLCSSMVEQKICNLPMRVRFMPGAPIGRWFNGRTTVSKTVRWRFKSFSSCQWRDSRVVKGSDCKSAALMASMVQIHFSPPQFVLTVIQLVE